MSPAAKVRSVAQSRARTPAARSVRPRTDLDAVRSRGWWRTGLAYDPAGIPCYWSPYLKQYIYIDGEDNEYVYDWHDGHYTKNVVLWWHYNRAIGRWQRVPMRGY